MTDLESKAILQYAFYKDKSDWELARFGAYCSLVPYSKKKLELTDVIKFLWENEPKDTQIDENELERLKIKAKQWEKRVM